MCVYTALLNGYEELNEQPVAAESSVDFICFTDDHELRSDSWSLRLVEPLFPTDSARSQRYVKICAHRAIPEYDVSLYIDNSVVLRRLPEEIFAALLPEDRALAAIEHSFRESVRDEFAEVARLGLEAESVCLEQEGCYQAQDPSALDARPLWSGMLLRRHSDPAVARAMELWYAHVLRYSRRDQLSLWFALRSTGVSPLVHELDNHESQFHEWPVSVRRDHGRAGASAALTLERKLEAQGRELRRVERELQAFRSMRSWRWTAPLRLARRRLRAPSLGGGRRGEHENPGGAQVIAKRVGASRSSSEPVKR